MTTTLRRVLTIRSTPPEVVVVAAIASYAGQALSGLAGWPLWAMVHVTLPPWLPLLSREIRSTFRHCPMPGLFAAPGVLQTGGMGPPPSRSPCGIAMATTDHARTAPAIAAFGARLGLFKELARRGPATSAELAARAGLHQPCVQEWLVRMATAGYLEYHPAGARFRLREDFAGETEAGALRGHIDT